MGEKYDFKVQAQERDGCFWPWSASHWLLFKATREFSHFCSFRSCCKLIVSSDSTRFPTTPTVQLDVAVFVPVELSVISAASVSSQTLLLFERALGRDMCRYSSCLVLCAGIGVNYAYIDRLEQKK